MTELEVAAVPTAEPTPGVHAVVTSCRESGRTITVVSNNSERAVRAYLTRHALDGLISTVIARTSPDPDLLKPCPHLLHQAITASHAVPARPAPSSATRSPTTSTQPARPEIHQHRLRQQTRQDRDLRRRQRRRHHHQPRPASPHTPSTPVAELSHT